jgi:hypothetical protein
VHGSRIFRSSHTPSSFCRHKCKTANHKGLCHVRGV